ncbi:MAG: phospholipase D-like domain-containing protein [bacterium]|nr:phospholipase D-like domain-containing protein [bacterium]
MSDRGGGELFIVDNSVSGWTGLRYLQQWTEIADSFDIATGFFEIGALLALDGKWQQLDKIRILMGDEVSLKTRNAFAEAIKRRIGRLDDSLEAEKDDNPFLEGADAVVEALKEGKVECRVYRRDKFHAKAYITHAKFDVVGAQALVGSSNFTRAGLTENVELNIQIQSGREVAQLQDWFDIHWKQAEEVTEDVLRTITRHTAEFTPFDVYAKALHEFFRGRELTAGEWDESHSRMFPHLDQYQREAYWSLMKIARQYGGAFLCDGVGLGKTFVGLMLVERLVLHENKRVVIFAPKAAKEGVWEPHLRRWLSHIGGFGGGADFSNLTVFSHTDLSRTGDFPERFERISELADAVVIDEAHHFRNPGRRGRRPETPDEPDVRSRYWRLYDLLEGSARPKQVFMLTATPVNNRLADFRHMVELFSRHDDAYFAHSLGVHNLTGHFNVMERHLQASLGGGGLALTEGYTPEARDALSGDEIFGALVVQRSRAYAKASQIQESGESSAFPERKPPKVADYSIRSSYGEVLDLFEKAFEKKNPLFSLAIYYPLAYYIGPDDSIDAIEENRQRQVVGLIRTLFLKRFESSVYAFEKSLDLLLRKLLAFVEVHSETDSEKKRYDRWKRQHASVIGYHPESQLGLPFAGEDEEVDADEDVVPPELLDAAADSRLSRDEYDVTEMLSEVFLDLDQISQFLDLTSRFTAAQDDKLKKLTRLLNSKDLAGHKVLVFTEFADTARYVARHLREAGIDGVEQIDGGSTVNRADVIRRFAPYYNASSSTELDASGDKEIRVLVSTDVLSEGLNLQDAGRLINYDIHWNPVRLMQRIGRVDRRMDPEVEARLVADHPELEGERHHVQFWNFLPPDDLKNMLSLYEKVTRKTLLISKTLGIEGRKLLTPDDDYEALREFNASYEGARTAVEDMHLEYQALMKEHPELAERLDGFPGSVFSGRKKLSKGARGVFFCYSLPALDTVQQAFTLEAGPTRWYLWDLDQGRVLGSPGEIIESLRSKPNTQRRCTTDRPTLAEARKQVLGHVRDTYLKQVNVPLDAPKPKLMCWMELN